jgi:DNA-directed RNA polymerase specialized sigma24 family protein
VLVLRYYGGYSLQEVADHLDVPLSTVKTWSARGLAALRDHTHIDLKEASDVI